MRARLLGDQPRHDRLHARPRERRLADQHLVRHRTERIHVAARIDGALAHRLLGTHVLRRAEREPGLRHPLAAGALHGERDAEVGHERVAALQQDVLRLDVAMDHAEAVRVAERIGDFARDADRFVDRQLAVALEARAQRLAGDQRHHVVEQAVGLAAVEQRQDVRMLQARRGADLGEEALAAERRAQVGVQHLDGDVAIVLEIVREVHGGHAALAELAVEAVAVGEGGGEAVERAHGLATGRCRAEQVLRGKVRMAPAKCRARSIPTGRP